MHYEFSFPRQQEALVQVLPLLRLCYVGGEEQVTLEGGRGTRVGQGAFCVGEKVAMEGISMNWVISA